MPADHRKEMFSGGMYRRKMALQWEKFEPKGEGDILKRKDFEAGQAWSQILALLCL